MRRGEIWNVTARQDYTSKPRPCVIVQDDHFDGNDSITVCGLTGDLTPAGLFRLPVEASPQNGLRKVSCIMADKITTVPRANVRECIGRLSDADMLRLNRALCVFLGLGSLDSRA